MKEIIMSKVGVGTVKMFQDGNKYWMTMSSGNIVVDLTTAENANNTYLNFKKAGYVVKTETTEKKVAAPKNRIIWSKDGKKIWATEYNFRKSQRLPEIRNLTGKAYHEARINLEAELKDEMKVWEAENAEKINAFLQNVVWKIAK